jgi:hypothetical protein
MKNFPLKRKYIYWGIAVSLVVIGIWWWRSRSKTPDPTKDNSISNGGTGGGSTYSLSIEEQCGKISDLYNKARSNDAFASAKLGRNLSPKKCQTYLLQHILNTRGGESLTLDGIFGPKTEAAVKRHTGQTTTMLKNHL